MRVWATATFDHPNRGFDRFRSTRHFSTRVFTAVPLATVFLIRAYLRDGPDLGGASMPLYLA
jgi:hypothetical protein